MSLASLLGLQQAGASAPVQGNEIVVRRNLPQEREQQNVDLYDGFDLNNVDAILERENASSEGAEAAEHKGMFGVKGTLRDILGVVGDAFLVQSGNDPIYSAQRQREREGDALTGLSRDPIAAVERMAGENPQMAAALLQQVQKQQAAVQGNQISAAKATNTINKNRDEQYREYSDRYSQLIGLVNPENIEQMIPLLEKLKERGGLGDELPLPETGSESWLQTLAEGSMTVNQRLGREQGEDRIDIGRQNARSNRIRASRKPAGRAPSKPTTASELARIRAVRNSGRELSQGDQETWDKFISGRGRSTSTGSTLTLDQLRNR